MHQTMIVSSDYPRARQQGDVIQVGTPLDAIVQLETPELVSRVVLVGSFATNRELATFLTDSYPAVEIECEA
jgi:hypothetical protein